MGHSVKSMGLDKSHPSFHFFFHLPHIHVHSLHHGHEENKELKDVPKGCMAVLVGQGEDQKRFVIPVDYINHPLFMHLLKEAEEEFGFDQKGPITIPCHVEEFRSIQDSINRENVSLHHHHNHHNGHDRCF